MPGFNNIVIVGAGPAGLLLALLLSKEGITVRVLEKADQLDTNPRATHYGSPAVYELRRAGVLDDVQKQGFLPKGACWRKLDGSMIAGINNTDMEDDPDSMVCLPLNYLGQILYRHLQMQPTATVDWQHTVTAIGQDEEKAWVHVTIPDGSSVKVEADYIVGCDGASSMVRRSLFGDQGFPGFTWDKQLVATNIRYDGFGDYWDANFIIHPEHWHMAARISNDGLWRVTYGEKSGLSRAELLERLPAKFQAILPSHPTADQYKVINFSPYQAHQRLAEKMRAGRFLLAADAAHLCNPFGGLGLTGGICDIGALHDCLVGIYTYQADESILDSWDEDRRKKYNEMINPLSQDNIRRLFNQDTDTAGKKDTFFLTLKRAQHDREFSRAMQKGLNSLRTDFTKFYGK